ncbi:unnamed protein product [Closterium sp. NIES-65]|nr:unnamed protein product [Closterium sp. NIES-65]
MTFRDLSAVFGLSKTLCHTLVDALLMHFPTAFKQQWVHFPTRDDLDEMAEEFRAIKGVPAVVGAIDGTHIHMKGMEGHRQEYYTRKSCYAVQLQITCDARGIIWDYLVGYPGMLQLLPKRYAHGSRALHRRIQGPVASIRGPQ